MGSLKMGAKQVVQTCLRVKEGERVVIIADRQTEKIASAIIKEMPRGCYIETFFMENLGKRPLSFPRQIGEGINRAQVGICLIQDVEGEIKTFRGPMFEIVENNINLRFASMTGINKRMMEEGMCSNYQTISKASRVVYQKLSRARKIRVASRAGTDMTLSFSPDLKWVICDGLIKKGVWSDLPDGEVFTCPIDAQGILVIDGCLGDYFDEKYGLLEKKPLKIVVKDGRGLLETISCPDKELEEEFRRYLYVGDENSNRIGEFALGTNLGIKNLIGKSLQDEKMPGVHMAFGGTYPLETGSRWDSDTHIDCIIKKPMVYLEGEIIMSEGKYLFKGI